LPSRSCDINVITVRATSVQHPRVCVQPRDKCVQHRESVSDTDRDDVDVGAGGERENAVTYHDTLPCGTHSRGDGHTCHVPHRGWTHYPGCWTRVARTVMTLWGAGHSTVMTLMSAREARVKMTPPNCERRNADPPTCPERGLFSDNLLVRIHFIIVMIRRTGLVPREFKFPFPGSLTSTFLGLLSTAHAGCAVQIRHFGARKSRGFFFIFTLVTGPGRSLSLKLSDTRVYEPQVRARLGTTPPPQCAAQ